MLEEAATRRGGRDPATEAPAGAARSAAGGGAAPEANATSGGQRRWGTPPCHPRHAAGPTLAWVAPLLAFFPRFLASTAPPPGAARGRHPRGTRDRGRHRRLAWFRTPEGSRGHAAVTQPGSVRKPEDTPPLRPGGGKEGNTSHATGSELERRPPCLNTGHRRGTLLRGAQKCRPAGGPLRRDPKGLIDQERKERERSGGPHGHGSWDSDGRARSAATRGWAADAGLCVRAGG